MKTKMLMVLCLALAPMGCKDSKEKIEKTRTQLAKVRTQVDMYYTMFDEYPDNLQALVQPPAGRRPLLTEAEIRDPWGKKLNYSNRNGDIMLASSGPDRKEGTADDIGMGATGEQLEAQILREYHDRGEFAGYSNLRTLAIDLLTMCKQAGQSAEDGTAKACVELRKIKAKLSGY